MSILSDELALSAYTDTTSEEAAAMLNAKTIAAFAPILTHDIMQYLALLDLLLEIEDSLSAACRRATRYLKQFPSFDVANPQIKAKLESVLEDLANDATIAFSAPDKVVIMSAGNTFISRAEQLGIRVTTGTIQDLRGEV